MQDSQAKSPSSPERDRAWAPNSLFKLGRAGASVAISDVDTEGLAVTEARLKAIGVGGQDGPPRRGGTGVLLLYADEVKGHFGKVNQIWLTTPASPSAATSRSASSRTSNG